MLDTLHLWLILALALSFLVMFLLFRFWRSARRDLRKALSSRQSLSTRYGKTAEQFMPFMASYPWDPQRFRFLGSPIDGVQFEDDRVILVEFKTASSRLSPSQRRVRDHVAKGRVEFHEVRMD